MKFGISISGLQQQPRGGDMRQTLRDIVGWVRLARDLGFDYLSRRSLELFAAEVVPRLR